MIVVEGSIRVADLPRAAEAMKAMIAASRAEAGCVDYAYALDLIDPHLVRVSERWSSRDALKAHQASDHIKAWRGAWPEIGVSERSLRMYEAEPEVI
jgi:quinol monooxygenase YgiN